MCKHRRGEVERQVKRPVVIVAGPGKRSSGGREGTVDRLLDEVLEGFGGTVIRPGADAGDNGRQLACLRAWIDLLGAGVRPEEVVVLGPRSEWSAAWDLRIGRALGARVAVIRGGGGDGGEAAAEPESFRESGVLDVPADAATLRRIVRSTAPGPRSAHREVLGRAIHEAYRRKRIESGGQPSADPALRAWEGLAADLRESSMQQADDIEWKLGEVGYELAAVHGTRRGGEERELPTAVVERLAELEHGRWNAERLLAGWRYWKERDPERRLSPYLVSWAELPDAIREYDREAVRGIAGLAAEVGMRVRRQR